jgi:hypothetical protein
VHIVVLRGHNVKLLDGDFGHGDFTKGPSSALLSISFTSCTVGCVTGVAVSVSAAWSAGAVVCSLTTISSTLAGVTTISVTCSAVCVAGSGSGDGPTQTKVKVRLEHHVLAPKYPNQEPNCTNRLD